MFVKNGTGLLKKVLLSRPTYLKPAPINEIAKKWEKSRLDRDLMEEEHQLFVKAYKENGIEVELLKAEESRPNAVFSRDFGGCVREGYILGRFKEPIRYQEYEGYKQKMEELGVPLIAEVKEGYFEGGDFAFLREDLIALGMAARTDRKGASEISEKLREYGYRILSVPLKEKYLHLDMCFNLVDENLAVACTSVLPEEFINKLKELSINIIEVSEESIFTHGCNLQSLGDKKVFSLKQNGKVNEVLAAKGMTVIELDITEILKAGGGPHCMTFPISRI